MFSQNYFPQTVNSQYPFQRKRTCECSVFVTAIKSTYSWYPTKTGLYFFGCIFSYYVPVLLLMVRTIWRKFCGLSALDALLYFLKEMFYCPILFHNSWLFKVQMVHFTGTKKIYKWPRLNNHSRKSSRERKKQVRNGGRIL